MDDKTIKLRELPVTVNVTKMAEGLIDLFTEEEKTVLRFGMLPAKKMEVLQVQLTDKFKELGTSYAPNTDRMFSSVNGETVAWSLRKLVSEATREITLGIYAIGELVV